MLAIFVALPHIFIIWAAGSLHMFACPIIREMMEKLPADAAQAYSTNVVVKTAGFFSDIFYYCFNWWFVLIPAIGLILQLLYMVINRQNEKAAQATMVALASIFSVIYFISLSTQLVTICMLVPNFLK
ncbi:MAG: hypothetical protein KKB51_11745 [Candidatus Riflebacteria bacterium]|nr:hypothetical protein [Candidatus Riflebacteria bacterium]